MLYGLYRFAEPQKLDSAGLSHNLQVSDCRRSTPKSAQSSPDSLWAPDILGLVWPRSGRPRRPGKAFKNVGGEAPHIFEGFPGPPGPARPQQRIQQIRPDCLQVPSTWARRPPGPALGPNLARAVFGALLVQPSQSHPEVVFWPSVFLQARGTKATKPQ